MFGLDRLHVGVYLSLGIGAFAFARTTFTKNYSFVDRSWSIVPVVYSWIFTDFSQPRTILMSSLVTLWGMRLTWNFNRKGGYSAGEEDYRWPILRKIITNPTLWHLFNLGFISFYQCILLMMLALPTYITSLVPSQWDSLDTMGTVLFLTFLVGETIADNQQWDFQTRKHELLKKSPLNELPFPYRVGFCSTGLFKYSRHPNYFCENMLWWTLCLFGLKAAIVKGKILLLFSGCFLLTSTVFIGSTIFTESITMKKYPLYTEYQRCVSFLIPWVSKPMKFKKE
jgi:steroid 5-alpha reductase family enzyme